MISGVRISGVGCAWSETVTTFCRNDSTDEYAIDKPANKMPDEGFGIRAAGFGYQISGFGFQLCQVSGLRTKASMV